ncbi:Conserved hypothetical protein [Clostridium neonatale]|nr:Conserved hypothetical protein [Clostridium neonatale]
MISPCYVLCCSLIITNDFINVLFFIICNLLDVKTLIYSYNKIYTNKYKMNRYSIHVGRKLLLKRANYIVHYEKVVMN